MSQRGFSLVELSIVLVILGLLVGGILAGQSLIRASELRAVSSEYARYTTALHAFRDKYFQLPGDMNNAESFWTQLSAVNSTCRDTPSTTTATCNGDGDGSIEIASTRSREIFRAWQHLANAGLIEGSYSGSWDGSNSWNVDRDNSPYSKLNGAAYGFVSRNDAIATGGFYSLMFFPNGMHWLTLGTPLSASYLLPATLKPEEAWNIDTKGDDGLPGQGRITTMSGAYQSCASSSVASSATYQLNVTSKACILLLGL